MFAKKGDHNFIQLQNGGGGSGANSYANFDLENGTKSDGATITDSFIDDFGNGWYRIGITFTTSSTTTSNCSIDIIDSLSAGRNSTFTGSVGDYFYVWGMQVEAGNYPTSYIPTYGTSTTRVADSCSKTGISELIGQTEGTMFVEFKLNKVNLPNNHTWIATKDSSQTNRILVYMLTNESTLRGQIKHSGTAINFNFGTISDNQNIKIAIAYKSGDSAVYINGSSVATNTNTLSFGTMDIFSFNDASTSVDGEVNQTILFPTRLTNDQLAELTK